MARRAVGSVTIGIPYRTEVGSRFWKHVRHEDAAALAAAGEPAMTGQLAVCAASWGLARIGTKFGANECAANPRHIAAERSAGMRCPAVRGPEVFDYQLVSARCGFVVGVVAVVAWGEWENWRASRRLVGAASGPSEAVVVLGYRNHGSCANIVNRWCVRAGLRSQEPARGPTRLILCGGIGRQHGTEAAVMGWYAQRSCGYQGQIVLEDDSRTTWENIQNAIPLIQDVDRIKIVSRPMHAYKARAYLHRQRPDLAVPLVRGGEYRLGEWLVAKPLLVAYGRWTTRHRSAGPCG